MGPGPFGARGLTIVLEEGLKKTPKPMTGYSTAGSKTAVER